MAGNASFTETVKASEPVASVVLAATLLGEFPTQRTLGAISILIFGTALSCIGEGTMFSTVGLLTALAANVMFALRSVYTKKLKTPSVGGSNVSPKVLFLYVSCVGVAFNVASYAVSDEPSLLAVVSGFRVEGAPRNLPSPVVLMLINGLCYATYNLSSFMVLQRMSVTGHAVFNVFRRVFIIAATMIAFRVMPTPYGMIGIMLSGVGFGLYITSKKK
mmetsp:Transcript_21035/g.64088  ORF Transcript_21035/g.64088 Transcript_21035/m.64088 type:complete len:218 (-) Transcript_21035:115-768(-)